MSAVPRHSAPRSRPRKWALPSVGDVFVGTGQGGEWSGQYRYAGLYHGNPHVGVFADEHGEECIIPFDKLHRVGLVDDQPAADAGAQLEQRLHRTRSRKTERQRAHGTPASGKQMKYIHWLARQRHMDQETLEAHAPRKSLKGLSMGEAGRLIDYLKRGQT